jgi:hypothetical protein
MSENIFLIIQIMHLTIIRLYINAHDLGEKRNIGHEMVVGQLAMSGVRILAVPNFGRVIIV